VGGGLEPWREQLFDSATEPEAGGIVVFGVGDPAGAALVDDADDHCRPLVSYLENAGEAAGGTRTAFSSIDFSGIVRFIFPRLGEKRKLNCDISQCELHHLG
jgi:hypothetical protein